MTVRIVPAAAALLLLAACARGEDAHPPDNMVTGEENAAITVEDELAANAANASDDARPTDSWIGKWVGVEAPCSDGQPRTNEKDYSSISLALHYDAGLKLLVMLWNSQQEVLAMRVERAGLKTFDVKLKEKKK